LCTYNGAKFLAEQLDSLLAQTLRPDEIVVVDDISSDETMAILKRYASGDSRFKIHVNRTSLGVIRNFEKAISLCTGDFIALSDQDDVWDPGKIEKLHSVLQKKKSEPAMAFCDLTVVDKNLNTLAESFYRLNRFEVGKTRNEILGQLMVQNFVPGCSAMITKKLQEVSLPFPKVLAHHDHWLALIAAANSNLHRIDVQLVKYRQHGKNATGATRHEPLKLISNAISKLLFRWRLLTGLERFDIECLSMIRALASKNFPDFNRENAEEISTIFEKRGPRAIFLSLRLYIYPRPLSRTILFHLKLFISWLLAGMRFNPRPLNGEIFKDR